MTHQTYKWKTADGIEVFGQSWAPEGAAKALICIVHGMGEHGGRYPHLVDYLVPKGYALIALDHRGHGKSGGQRGHMPSFDAMMNDMDIFLAQAAKAFPGLPVFLYGHSMGGNVATNYVLRRKPAIKALIASAPYYRLAFNPPAWKVSLGKTMAKLIPSLSQSTALEVSAISRDAAEVEKYKKDPLVHDKISAAFFVNIHPAGEYAIEHAAELTVPTLVIHGNADRLTSHTASKEFVQKAGSKAEYKEWDSYYHEMHNDIGREAVLQFVGDWLDKQL